MLVGGMPQAVSEFPGTNNFRKADFVYQRFDKESGYLESACVNGAIYLKKIKPCYNQINHRYRGFFQQNL